MSGETARGHDDSFEALAALHRPEALRIARVVLRDADSAEDVAQLVLMRLRKSLPELKDTADLSSWVYRVTVNLCRDTLRSTAGRSGAVALDADILHPELVAHPRQDKNMDLERAHAAVRRAASQLPDDQKQMLMLRYSEGLSYTEIARITNTPQGTVASRVFRALKRLGEEIDPWHMEVLK